jgi:hypothetical protein
MIWLVARHGLRSRWRALTVLVVIVVVWGAATMTALAGARRTASVVDRYLRETAASDATFSISQDHEGTRLRQALDAHPDVVAAESLWNASTGLAWDLNTWVGLISGDSERYGSSIDRAVVLHGRLADPARPDEVVVAESAAHLLGVGVGDQLHVPTFAKAEWDAWLPVRGAYPGFNGPTVDVTVVGVVRLGFELAANPGSGDFVLATPAFRQRWGDQIGDNGWNVVTTLRPGADANAIAEQLSADLGRVVSVATTDDVYADHLRSASAASRAALLLLGAVAFCAGAFVVALAANRIGRASAQHHAPVTALGATQTQRLVAFSAPIVAAGCVAVVPAIGLSAWASRWLPVGPVGRAETRRGVWLDAPVLVAGSVLMVLVVSAATAFGVGRQGRSARPTRAARTGVFGRFGPALMIGRLNALGSSARRLTIVAGALTIAGLFAAGWYALSLDDLRSSPARWGYTWSSSPEATFPGSAYNNALDSTVADPDIAGVSVLAEDTAFIGGQAVEVTTFLPYDGTFAKPAVLAGREPQHPGEMALGRRTAARLRVGVGDTVDVASALKPSGKWLVVGLVVPPTLPTSIHPGDGAFVVPADHLDLFGDTPAANYLALLYRHGVDVAALEARLARHPGWRFELRSHARQPGTIANLSGVAVLLPWLAVLFAVLGVGVTALMSTRVGVPHRRVVRSLRALGFTPRNVGTSVIAEALIVGVASLSAGLVVGFLAARVLWNSMVARLGVVPIQSSPVPILLVTIAFGVVILGVAALIGSVRVNAPSSRRTAPEE